MSTSFEGAPQLDLPHAFNTSVLGQLLCAVSWQCGTFGPEYLRYAPDRVFYEEFSQMVQSLDMASLAVPAKRHKLNLHRYAFVSVVATEVDRKAPESCARNDVIVPEEIEMTYGTCGWRSLAKNQPHRYPPYLDSQHAIGLVYDNWLVAIAGLIAAPRRPLTLIQLQGVSGARPGTPEFGETGLSNGLLWRRTLLAATEEIARRCGYSSVAVQSYKNSYWSTIYASPRGKAAYDDVAEQSGFKMRRGEWIKYI